MRSLLSTADAIDWVEAAFRRLGDGRAQNLPRQRIRLPKGTLHVLPAGDPDAGVLGLKSYTSFRGGNRFAVLLYSAEDGRLLAIVEADYLGMMRTGAASGIATRELAPATADVMALFGTGWQATGQLRAIAAVRRLSEVRVFGRDDERRRAFAARMSEELGIRVVPAPSPEAALEGAPIVTTVTTASTPLFPEERIGPGTHINAAGSNSLIRREIDERLVRRADLVVVDSREQARLECGDLLVPVERGWLTWDVLPELGEILVGRAASRANSSQVSIFESQGLGLLDVAVAAEVHARAMANGVGDEVTLFA